MESIKIRIILLILLVLALCLVFRFVRRKELQLKYSLVWILVDLLMIIAVAIPNILGYISNLLGIYSVTNMLFFLGIMFVLAIIFSLTVALSRAAERIRQLSQQVALNEYKARHAKVEMTEEVGVESE